MRRACLALAVLPCLLVSPACKQDPPAGDEAEETETGEPLTCLDTQVPGEDIIIHSDADMEELALSGCVAEHIIVSGGAVTSLAGLSELRQVGILDIRYNPTLNSLAGIENLERVDSLIITGNNLVTDLPSFPNLRLGRVSITANNILADLGSFPAATDLTRLELASNLALTDFSGFENLTEVSGDAIFSNNPLIVDFTGFEMFGAVGGDLTIEDNPELLSFDGFGLQAVTGGIRIVTNPKLSDCLVADFLAMLQTGGGAIVVNGNKSAICD